MHDGSTIVLKNTEKDYDPTNRAAAIQMLVSAQEKNQLLTGLIYLNEDKPVLADQYNLVEKPLNRLTPEEIRPKPETIKKINDLMF